MTAKRQDPARWSESGAGAPDALRQLLQAARRDLPDTSELRAMGLLVGPGIGAIGEQSGPDVSQLPQAADAPVLDGASHALAQQTGPSASAGAGSSAVGSGGTSAGATAGGTTAQTAVSQTLFSAGAKWLAGTALATAIGFGAHAQLSAERPVSSPDAPPASQPAPQTPQQAQPALVAEHQVEEAVQPPLPSAAAETHPGPAPVAAQPAKPATPASEAVLLQQANAALKTQPARALALTQEHRVHFPAGRLIQEREVIRIEALRKLGRSAEAERAARSFEQRFPDSALRRRVAAPTPSAD